MSDKDRQISGSVKTESVDGKHRVTLDLAKQIAFHEKEVKKDRSYWLDLYCECFAVVNFGNRQTK